MAGHEVVTPHGRIYIYIYINPHISKSPVHKSTAALFWWLRKSQENLRRKTKPIYKQIYLCRRAISDEICVDLQVQAPIHQSQNWESRYGIIIWCFPWGYPVSKVGLFMEHIWNIPSINGWFRITEANRLTGSPGSREGATVILAEGSNMATTHEVDDLRTSTPGLWWI